MILKLSQFFIGLFFAISSFAQSIDVYFSSQNIGPFQKLYLHTDREYYFIGDTLWFSPYIFQPDNKLMTPDCNLYVELIDSKGQVVEEKNFILDKGICSGYLGLSIIAAGTYVLRAYTDFMKPLGEECFFRKTIKINYPWPENQNGKLEKKLNKKIFIDFYPEGGFILDRKLNQIAFTAHDQDGQPIDLTGKLLCNDGTHSLIKTVYKGAGSFFFIPKSEQQFRIQVEGIEDVQFNMPEIRQQGAKLMLTKVTDKDISIFIISSDNLLTGEFYIALFHRGTGTNYIKIEKEKLTRPILIKTDYLGVGINKLVLLNAQFEPLSERLIFIDKNNDYDSVNVDLEDYKPQTRQQVKMNLGIPSIKDDDEWARISISVVNENMVGYKGNLLDIRSYLLLDSELKGQIQAPRLYFNNDDSIPSARKLDLLMLTNGWRNYVFNDIKEKIDIDFSETFPGFTFTGKVQKEIANKPLKGADVVLKIVNNEFQDTMLTKTDDNGCFKFDPVVFFDTTLVIIQSKNSKGNNNSRVELNNTLLTHFNVEETNYKNIEDIGDLSLEMYRLKSINELELKEFLPDRYSIVLDDVKVVAEKKENSDNYLRIYDKPFQSNKLTYSDRTYQDIFQYLNGRFAGVEVIDNKVYIRGIKSLNTSNDPLFLLDGRPIDPVDIRNISMNSIDVIEVVKPPESAVFGMRGANGVISVFTRRGIEYTPVVKEIPGTIIKRLQGFEKFRVFYSPVYNNNNLDSEIPDYRQTLYWNPSVIVDSETKSLSFFTCDNLGTYKIFVEGITTSGKICTGGTDFIVDERK